MKFIASRILIALVVLTMTASIAFAKTDRANITLSEDTHIGSTVLKNGDYYVKFDDKTNELSFIRNGKEVLKVPARIEKRENKAKSTELHILTSGSELTFVGIAFGGSDQNVIVS
jgi:hypothetical protein